MIEVHRFDGHTFIAHTGGFPSTLEKEDDWDAAFQREGFVSGGFNWSAELPFGDSPIILWVAHDRSVDKYIVQADLIAEGCLGFVVVSDLPALFALAKVVEPFVRLSERFIIGMGMTIAGKVFEAWHGHDVENICAQCAKSEWTTLQQKRQERLRKGGK